jgi:hypothetical protein
MHIAIAVFVVVLVWEKGVWRDWEKYHSTMLFFGFIELIYNLIAQAHDYFLWRFVPDMGMPRIAVVAIYVFITFPCTALLYLNSYPSGLKEEIIYIIKWVLVYGALEWIGGLANRITYVHNWGLWSSVIFDFILFWGLRLHFKKPVIAYIVFVAVTIIGIIVFKIPVTDI